MTFPYHKAIESKNKKFESFIKENLNITKEYNSSDELQQADFQYDYYISGSDQLWNTTAPDFSWSYFLPFVKNIMCSKFWSKSTKSRG